jgi:hypothetical protein
MTQDNLKSIGNTLSEIEKINISERIATQFKDKDLETIIWYETTAFEFPCLACRVIAQLRGEMESGAMRFYPNIFPSETPNYQNKNLRLFPDLRWEKEVRSERTAMKERPTGVKFVG